MMLLGLQSVIDADELQIGKFYLRTTHNGDSILFQCVVVGEDEEGNDRLAALSFSPGSKWPVSVDELPDYGPVVSLDNVAIRVDAASASGTNFSGSIKQNLFFVAGADAFVVAPIRAGWITFNLMTGRRIPINWKMNWISFSRWIIVMDDNGEEISIANFDEEEIQTT